MSWFSPRIVVVVDENYVCESWFVTPGSPQSAFALSCTVGAIASAVVARAVPIVVTAGSTPKARAKLRHQIQLVAEMQGAGFVGHFERAGLVCTPRENLDKANDTLAAAMTSAGATGASDIVACVVVSSSRMVVDAAHRSVRAVVDSPQAVLFSVALFANVGSPGDSYRADAGDVAVTMLSPHPDAGKDERKKAKRRQAQLRHLLASLPKAWVSSRALEATATSLQRNACWSGSFRQGQTATCVHP